MKWKRISERRANVNKMTFLFLKLVTVDFVDSYLCVSQAN